jgi:hypothetical protein
VTGDSGAGVGSWVALIIVLAIYFLPAIIAMNREHMSAGAIFALNLLVGWTLVGWLFAFIWSLTGNTKRNLVLLIDERQSEYNRHQHSKDEPQAARPVEPAPRPVEPIRSASDKRQSRIGAAIAAIFIVCSLSAPLWRGQ